MACNEVTLKIKEDWGTVKHFCKKNSINESTLRQIIYGLNTSSRIVKVLLEHKYINKNHFIYKRLEKKKDLKVKKINSLKKKIKQLEKGL